MPQKGTVQHQERTSQLRAPFARKRRMRWTTWLPHPHGALHKNLTQIGKAETYWASLEQGRKAESIISRHAAGLITVHRDCLCNKLSRFCHGWGQQPAQLPWTLCNLSSFLPTGICYHWHQLPESLPNLSKAREPQLQPAQASAVV